jgi:hypothetical protein
VADSAFARAWSGSSSTLLTFYVSTTGTLGFYIQGDAYPAGYVFTTDSISDNTWYHGWIHYKVSSGATDGLLTFEFTPASTRTETGTGNKFATRTHNITTQITRSAAMLVSTGDAGYTVYFDQWLDRGSSIGTVCE